MRPEFEKLRAQVNALRAQRAMAREMNSQDAEGHGDNKYEKEDIYLFIDKNLQKNTKAD